MMKKFLFYLVTVTLVLTGLLRFSIEFETAQNIAMRQFAGLILNQQDLPQSDRLRVYVCGSASPLGRSDQAQSCLAVVTPQHFYIVDSGAGAAANVARASLPMHRLRGVFLTHFHSDHIGEIYEMNLASWIQGRPEPLRIFGPKGVRQIVSGINETYEQDRGYRVEHHGSELLPPELGKLVHKSIKEGTVLEDGDLTVTAYFAEHHPVSPALGFRFDYRGRSVVISGDSNITEDTRRITANTDLLFHDALSVPAVTAMAEAADEAGAKRLAKIMYDVLDYHASTESIIELGESTKIGMVAYYHLVPTPGNILVEKFFERDLPENFRITKDGDWYELPANSTEINVVSP